MQRNARWWALAALVAALIAPAPALSTPDDIQLDTAKIADPDDAPNPYPVPIGPFTIYDSHCRTPEAWNVAEQWGIGATPLMTKHRYYDEYADDINLETYAQKIWTPGQRPECTAYLNGVPPWFGGPIWLDYELWDEFRHPDDYTLEQIVRRYLQYVTLIEATRAMRPGNPIILHNMLRKRPEQDPLIAALEYSLHLLVEATSPSMWVQCPVELDHGHGPQQDAGNDLPDNCLTFEESWEIYERLLKRALEVKAETGLEVYPAIWFRFKRVNEPVPEWLMRVHLARILTFEWAGQRVDGYCILGGSNPTDEPRIDHMVIAAEVATEVANDLGFAPPPVATNPAP